MTAVDVWTSLDARLDPTRRMPRLADDVEVARFPLRDGSADVVAHDPRGGGYLRLSEAEADLLSSFDGSTTVAEVVAERLGASGDLDAPGVVALVQLLHRRGFLDQPYVDLHTAVEHAVQRAHQSRLQRLWNMVSGFDAQWRGADRFMRALYRGGAHRLFSPVGKALTAAVGLVGFVAFIVTTAAHGFTIASGGPGTAVVSLLLLDLVSVFVHESGHALVLIRHGRRVNGAGIRLYFGLPGFYIESTDALMMSRSQRLWQTFAGPWAEFVVGSLAGLTVALFPEGPAAPVLWQFSLVCYVTVALNLVPLLELDGYWMLSDGLRVRDLRPRSLAFLRRDLWRKLRRREMLTRVEVGLTLYGTAGVAFTALVCVAAARFWGDLSGGLVRELWEAGPLGVAGLALLVLVIGAPLVAASGSVVRSLLGRLRRLVRRVRFRTERRWRVDAARILDDQPVFDDVPVSVLNQLAGLVDLRQVSAGETVIHQGDRGDAYYLVRSGTFEVVDEAAQPEAILRHIGRGAAFGEIALVNNSPRSAAVRALEAGQLYVISRSTFDRLLAGHAELRDVAATLHQLEELRSLPPFAHLGPAELADLADHGRWRHLAPGSDIVTQGDAGTAFYVVQSGRCEVHEDGEVVRAIGAGDPFGELALIHQTTRTATVRAVSPVRVFELDAEGFRAFVRQAFATSQVRTPSPADRG